VKKTGSDKIALEDHLGLDLGLDSLALVELIAALEENFQFKIKEEQFYSIFTVAELIDFVEAQKPGGEAALSPQARSWADILSIEPPPDRLRLVGMEQNLPQRLFTPVCSLLFGTLFKLLFELKVQGQEHLQAQNCIICPNHVSFLDGFLIFGAVPWALRSRLFFAGATDYFELPVLRDFAKVMRVIPINAARRLVDAMQAAAYILRQGKILCIFPEGSRSVTGDLLPLKNSTAILAKELGCTVVPAYIAGSYQAWPPGAPLPRPHPIKVIFGPARTFAELTEQGLHLNPHLREFDTASLGLRQQILKLKESAG
jgi:long-chain acyl-CoA synthetase